MTTITARHEQRDGQIMTAIDSLPGPDEYLPREHWLNLARQIHEKAIDAQRLASEPPRHPVTPGYFEYPDKPTFDESASFDPAPPTSTAQVDCEDCGGDGHVWHESGALAGLCYACKGDGQVEAKPLFEGMDSEGGSCD